MVDVLLRHKGEYHVYFYMAPPLNESIVTVRTERRRTCKLYIRYCFSSHSPALLNVCSLYHIMLLSFVLFARDTHNNHDDWIINDTSYYLELSAVYGYNQATHDTVRDKSKGRGLLYPDAFAEDHLLFLPLPPCLIHNFISEAILKIKITLPLIPSWRRNRTRCFLIEDCVSEIQRATPLDWMHSTPSNSRMDRLSPGTKVITVASNSIC